MRSLKITSANGSSMTINQEIPYILQALKGTGTPDSTAENLKAPNQDGSTHIQTLFNERDLDIEVAILQAAFEDVFTLQEEVCKILNPKYELELIYTYPGGVKRTSGRLDGEVKFMRGAPKGYQKAVFSIECNNPFWLDEADTGVELAVSVAQFHFPLIFSPSIVFSVILNKTVAINNQGHVPTPINIKFNGPATNPIVTNETTGEFIKVNKVLAEGEVLEINTAFGNKYVRIGETNAFGFIDPDSEFFDLEPGINTITYDADSGAESATVLITYSNRYTGV